MQATYELLKATMMHTTDLKYYVEKFIRECPICQKSSEISDPVVVKPFTSITLKPMQRINVDTIGPLPVDKNGFRYIVVIIDTFTRYMNTYPAKTLEGDECAVILNWFVARYGVPDEIVTDNGGQFINNHLKYLMELMQVQHIKITPYSHEENGIVERVNKEVMRHLRNIIFNVKVLDNWAAYLPFAERIINSSKHSDTGRSPAELVFGQAVDSQRNIYNLNDRLIEAYKVPENLNEWEIWAREKLSEQQIVIEAAKEYQMRNIQSRMNKKAIEDPTVFEVGSLVLH